MGSSTVNVLKKKLVTFFHIWVNYLQTCKCLFQCSEARSAFWQAVPELGSYQPPTHAVATHGEDRTRDGDPSSPVKPPIHQRSVWQIRSYKRSPSLAGPENSDGLARRVQRSDRRLFGMAMGMQNEGIVDTQTAQNFCHKTPNCHFLCDGE